MAIADDHSSRPTPSSPLINTQSSSRILGPHLKRQLFAVSGCPNGYVWSWTKTRGVTVDASADVDLNQDLVNLTANDFFTEPIGGVEKNPSGAITGGYDSRTYTVYCKDSLNPTTRSGPSASITVVSDYERNGVIAKNTIESCGSGDLNTGAKTLITAEGCGDTGETYWVHPNPSYNFNTFGTESYWVSRPNDGATAVTDNAVQDGNFTARCNYRYYDDVTHLVVEGLTDGRSTYVKRKQSAPSKNEIVSTYFKLRPNTTTLQICPDDNVDMSHHLFNGGYDSQVSGYSIEWYVNGAHKSQFNNQKVISTSFPGGYTIKLVNNDRDAAKCDVNYDQIYKTITIVPNDKLTLAGNSQICPGGSLVVSISNGGTSPNAAGNTYKWYINNLLVAGTESVLTVNDQATSVQATYLTISKDDLGRTCNAPKSDAFVITKYNRPASPAITQTSGNTKYCENLFPVSDVTIEANNPIGDKLKNYTWSVGNTPISGNTTNTINSNIATGRYTAILTDVNGCNSLASNTILIDRFPSPVKPKITNSVNKDNIAYCDYNIPFSAISLTSQNTSLLGSPKYKWSTGSTASTIDVTVDGKYTVTVTDDLGCISQPGTFEIVKNTRPITPIITNTNGLDAYCDNKIPFAAATLQANNTSLVGAPKYVWNTGSAIATTTVTKEGIYSVTVTDANDCASLPGTYEIVKNTRPAKPVITRKTGADAYCDYKFPVSDLTLESSNTSLSGSAIYTWNQVVKTKVIPVTAEGTYSVVVTDGNGCESVSSDAYTITKWTSPVAPKIALTGKNINCSVDENDKAVSVAFSVSSATDAYSFEWFNTGSSNVLSKTNALPAVNLSGTYYSVQTDKNGCYSPKSDGIKLTFVQNPNISTAKIAKIGAYGLKAEGFGAVDNATAGDYQWKSGTTTNSNTIDNIKVSAANNGNGDYSVKRKYAFTVEGTPIVCFSNLVKYTFVADPDFTGVAVYPNPTSGTVKIDLLDEWKNATVVVYDLVGRPVYNGTMDALTATGGSLSIDLSSLGSGLYILQIKSSTGDKSYQGKILVNK